MECRVKSALADTGGRAKIGEGKRLAHGRHEALFGQLYDAIRHYDTLSLHFLFCPGAEVGVSHETHDLLSDFTRRALRSFAAYLAEDCGEPRPDQRARLGTHVQLAIIELDVPRY
jgi:hypothetical protein